MKKHWTNWTGLSVLAGAGAAVVYAVFGRTIRRAIAEHQHTTDRQLAAMTLTVKALQARVAELNREVGGHTREMEPIAAAAEGAESTQLETQKPETLAVITAAATAFLGRAARVRSARLVPAPPESVSPWTQQGRMIVQTSHNLRSRD